MSTLSTWKTEVFLSYEVTKTSQSSGSSQMSIPAVFEHLPYECSRPPHPNVRIVLDIPLAREYLHNGLLVWRNGEPTNSIGPCWVPHGAYGIFIED